MRFACIFLCLMKCSWKRLKLVCSVQDLCMRLQLLGFLKISFFPILVNCLPLGMCCNFTIKLSIGVKFWQYARKKGEGERKGEEEKQNGRGRGKGKGGRRGDCQTWCYQRCLSHILGKTFLFYMLYRTITGPTVRGSYQAQNSTRLGPEKKDPGPDWG